MDKNVTLQTLDKDLKRELRINNYLQVWNRSLLVQANQNIIGSTVFLGKQIGILSNSFSMSLKEQTAVLSRGLSKINRALSDIESNIVAVGETLKLQTNILKSTLDKLDEIHDTLKHPLEVESKEQFERGVQWLEKGFLTEAADAFRVSIEKNPTNFLSHFYLGVLYLCGKDEDDDVIDFAKSEEELKLAIKYSKPDITETYVKQYVVAMHQHLSDLYYALGSSGQDEENNYQLAYEELQKAMEIDNSLQTKVCLISRLMKCANKLGKTDDVLDFAKFGFIHDNSLLSFLVDESFSEYHNDFVRIIDEIRPEIKKRIIDFLSSPELYDDDGVISNVAIEIINQHDSVDSYELLSYLYGSLIGIEKKPIHELYGIYLTPIDPYEYDQDLAELYYKDDERWEKNMNADDDSFNEREFDRYMSKMNSMLEKRQPLWTNLEYNEASNLKCKIDKISNYPFKSWFCELRSDQIQGVNLLLGESLLLALFLGTDDSLVEEKIEQLRCYISDKHLESSICNIQKDLYLVAERNEYSKILDLINDAYRIPLKDYFSVIEKEAKTKFFNNSECYKSSYDERFNKLVLLSSKTITLPNGKELDCSSVGFQDLSSSSLTKQRYGFKEKADTKRVEYERVQAEKKEAEKKQNIL